MQTEQLTSLFQVSCISTLATMDLRFSLLFVDCKSYNYVVTPLLQRHKENTKTFTQT